VTRSAALAWGKQDIRVNAVGPGFTPTPFVAAATEEYRAQALAQMPLGRFPQPEDIAATVAFLGSDEARAITGGLYMVDSGFTVS
jgi:NAD(P)-dependent dehydrogenase (short-subunit alcohol dehydrogenase family)